MTDIIVKDSNGSQLHDGDSVTLIKDLKVKGTSETLKRGTLVKGIRLTDDPGEIECSTKQGQRPRAENRVFEEGIGSASPTMLGVDAS